VCAACHGADGNSTDVNNPRLAGQHADYIAKALRDYKSGERANPIMKGFATALSKQDIENLAAHFASQKSALSSRY
jgi:cytochrome c553